jgi:hypothetical protein
VLDLKPYVAYTDALPDAAAGWLKEALDPAAAFFVEFSDEARAALGYLAETWELDLTPAIRAVLTLGPQAHPYRRIRRDRSSNAGADAFVLAVKEWRARFVVEGSRIVVLSIRSGYRPRDIATNQDAALDPHRAFVERFGI